MEYVKTFLRLACCDGLDQLLPINAGPQSRIENGLGLCLDHVPSLGLASVGLRHTRSVFIIGMDLNAEYSLAVEILQKEGKSLARGIISGNLMWE
jgi:hypothetical protein